MDLKSMNRKELQALCKKHEIPANTSNSQMIESLSSILQEKVKPKGCLKGSGGSSADDLGVFQGGSKKVTFVVEDGEEDGNEGFVVNPVGRWKRKSVGRRSGVAAKFENSSGSDSPKNAIEVPQRTTRSRGLAEAVLWSPVIEKKKMKKSVDGTEGVRQNAKEKKGISVAVPMTRSLRNRVVTVGGDEEAVTDQNLRRTRKTKDSVKEEENEKVADLEEDEAVGRRNLRKRSRDAVSVEDEPPRRRSTRSHVMLEEAEAVEEVDVGRSRKRRKGDLEISVVEKVVDAETERVSKFGGSAKRIRGNTLGDANNSEIVATSTRRSTRSSSVLLEDGNFAAAVGKSDREGDAVRKGNYQKQANARVSKGGDSVNLLTDSEVLAEPIRRSTRSSSTLPEDGTSLPAVVKSVKGGVAVRKGKSLKQAKDNSSKGGKTTSLPDSEAIAMPIRRSTRSSSSLLENVTSIPVVGKAVEEGEVVTTPTRRSTRSSSKQLEDEKPNEAVNTSTRWRSIRSSSKLLEVEMPNNEVVNSPTKRSTRCSSKLLDDEMPNYEAVNSLAKRSIRSSSKLLEVKMPNNEAFISPMRKSTRSSSKLMEDEMPDSEVVTSSARKSTRSSSKLLEIEMPKNEAVTSLTKRATHSSSKLLEDEMPSNEAVSKPTRRLTLSSSKQGDSTAPLQYSEAVTPARRLARSSSKSVADVIRNKEAVTTSTRRSTHSSLKLLEDEILDTGSLTTPTRRSTCSSSKMLAAETSLPVVCKLDVQNDAIRNDDSEKQPTDHTSKQVDSTVSLSNNDAVITPTRRSTCSYSDIQVNVSGEPMCSYIDVTVDAEGPLELYGDVISKVSVSVPVELTSPTVKPSSGGTSVGALDDVVGIAGMVSQNITPTPLPLKSSGDLSTTFHTEISTVAQLKEPDSAVEVVELEDMVTGYEEAHDSSPQFPCKSSAELSLTFDTEASPGIHLEGFNSQAEIHDYTEDALEGNEAADIREPTFVCKSSELLSPSFNSVASPVTNLKELDSNVEVEGSSEDVSKIIDPMTSNIEVCPNAEEFDAKVEVHITGKGGMEGTDDKNTAGLPLSCKSTGVLLPTLPNEVSPDINLGESVLKVGSHDMSKVASHPNDFLVDASDNHSKTLKVSMTADWDALYLSDIQRMFDNETENCTTDQDSALNVQSDPGECDVGKKVESLPVNEGIGTEENKSDAETNGDEGRPSSSSENPAFDLCSGDLMKEHGTQSSEEIVDQATALCSLGNAKQSDFTQSLCDEDLAGVDGNLRDSFDDKFCEGNNDHFLSPDAFVKFEDNESSHYKIGVVSSDIREENLNVEHCSFIQSSASGSKSVKQMENEDRLHDADLKSTGFSASANDNRSPISLGYEGSTMQVGIQDFPCIPDSGDSRHLSDQQDVMVNVTENLDVDSADRSPKSTPKEHDTVKPLNVVADILSETANTANEHTDMESERVHELCVVVAEETENLEFLESDASIVGGDDIVMKKADSIGQDKFDHVEAGRQQDEAHLLQETKALSGEHHTDDIASHPSLGNSDSGDSRHLSDQQEVMVNVTESFDVDSADRSPKSTPKTCDTVKPLNVVADILSETADTANEHSDMEFERIHELGGVVAEETENLEFLECDADIEGGDDIVVKKADSIGQDKFDHVEVGRQQDETHLLQETKALSGEHHTDDIASHLSLGNSDSGDSRHLSDQQEVMVNVTESLDVDSADRSPKSSPKAHDTVKPLNVVADILSATADTANEHTDMESERIHELGGVVAEETENLEFLECDAGIEGGDDIVMKEADSIGQDKFDHVEVGRQQDEAYLLQESKALSGEHHTDDIASHPSLENSDSGDSRHLSDQQEVMVNVTESLDVDSADRSPKSTPKAHDTVKPLNVVADILSETADTANEHTDMKFERIHELGGVVAEESENLEFLECDAGIEGGDDIVMKKADSIGQDKFDHVEVGRQQDEAYLLHESKALSGEHHTDDIASHLSLGNSASMSEETLLSLEKFDSSTHRENESNDEKEIGAKGELRLPCNIHEGLNAALGESKEERAHVSPIKPESTPEATMIGEQHTAPTSSESTPLDTLNCIEAGLCKESSFGGANSVDIRGEDNDLKGVYITNNDTVELKESSDLNTIIASSKTAEREHGVDHCINMSFCWMAQDSKDTGISENNEASPSASSSPKSHTQDEESNRYQGKLESFVQASSGEATWAAPGGTLMFVEELFHTDSKGASSVNDSAPVGQLGHHSENLAHGKCGNFSEEAVAIQEGEMKAIAVSESSVAKIEEARPYECVMSSEIFSGGSAKPCADMDSQATHSAELSEGQEGRRAFTQENLELSKDTMFALLDSGKIEGSAILESKFEGSETTPLPRVANQELITKNFTELSVTNVTDQALWDRKEPMESRSVGNALEDSKLRETVTAQHALVSLDAGAARHSSTAIQEGSVVGKDEIMAPEEYFEDFGWSFADTFDDDSSLQEVQAVDSKPPMESRIGNSADHSSKSGIDVNQEQSKSSEHDQIEESMECVQGTPMQLVRNFMPYSVIDDAIKNKENTVGLKMDSSRKHNDKSTISNSSRRPLQSVRRDKEEH